MSARSKRTVKGHRHLDEEIYPPAVKSTPPQRPATPAIHASDLIVDSVLTLDETVVEFTRKWEAENPDLIHGTDVTTETDVTASAEKCVKLLSTKATQTLVRTNGIEQGGEWNIVFRLKVASNASGSTVVKIGSFRDGVGWHDYRNVKANEFSASDTWQYFAVRTSIPQDWTWSICVTFMTGITDLECDYIGFLPANVPLAYADIDIPSQDAIDDIPAQDALQSIASGYMQSANVLGLSLGSEVNVLSDDWYTLRSGTSGSIADAINICDCDIYLQRGASGGAAYIWVKVNIGGSDIGTWLTRIDGNVTTLFLPCRDQLFSIDAQNKTCTVSARAVADSVYVRAAIYINQFKKHTHADIEYSPAHGQTGELEYSPARGQTGGSDLGHEH